jgi:branched-chain amino acid aminotransferase
MHGFARTILVHLRIAAAAVQNENAGVTMRHIANLTQPSVPLEPVDPKQLEFGKMFTPNFFITEYRNGEWNNPRIQPLGPFALHPASTVFHYSQTVFEGLKAFRHNDGQVALFRPDMNAKRLRHSCDRLAIPPIDEALFLDAIAALVENERHFVPPAPGCLYIRPTVMGVDASLGVKSASEFIFFVLTVASGPYFKGAGEGPGAIDVFVTKSVVRACPGGTGSAKTGGNYAGTLRVTEEAKRFGCSQVLFLDAHDHRNVEEMGGMNVMFVQNGRLRTPPLTDTILAGITRQSLLVLAKELGFEASEERIAIDEVVAGVADGSITEMMACGTAAVVVGIRTLSFEDGSKIQLVGSGPGPVTRALYEALVGIQYGRSADRHGWIRKVCDTVAAAPLR